MAEVAIIGAELMALPRRERFTRGRRRSSCTSHFAPASARGASHGRSAGVYRAASHTGVGATAPNRSGCPDRMSRRGSRCLSFVRTDRDRHDLESQFGGCAQAVRVFWQRLERDELSAPSPLLVPAGSSRVLQPIRASSGPDPCARGPGRGDPTMRYGNARDVAGPPCARRASVSRLGAWVNELSSRRLPAACAARTVCYFVSGDARPMPLSFRLGFDPGGLLSTPSPPVTAQGSRARC